MYRASEADTKINPLENIRVEICTCTLVLACFFSKIRTLGCVCAVTHWCVCVESGHPYVWLQTNARAQPSEDKTVYS